MIYIIGQINETAYLEFSRRLAALEETKSGEPAKVEIASEGGHSFDGLTFYGRIRTSSVLVHMKAHGLIHSAATLVFAAGDIRNASRECSFMLHDSQDKFKGTVREAHKFAKQMEREEQQWANLLEVRTGVSEKVWRRLSKKQTYLTAAQAKQLGLVHNIIEEKI